MRAGIAVDDWKVKIFKKHLKDSGYEYELGRGPTDNTRMLYVETDDPEKLGETIQKANDAAAMSRRH